MSPSREFIIILLTYLAVGSLVAWVVTNPPTSEQFVSLGTLGPGPQNLAGLYFLNNTRTVRNATISWTVQAYNHMGSSQLFRVEVWLVNRNVDQPSVQNNTFLTNRTSISSLVFREYHASLNNETWNMPLVWSIVSWNSTGTTTTVHEMQINGRQTLDLDVTESNLIQNNFRLVIELWTYDVASHTFLFSYYPSGSSLVSLYNQIWFTVR